MKIQTNQEMLTYPKHSKCNKMSHSNFAIQCPEHLQIFISGWSSLNTLGNLFSEVCLDKIKTHVKERGRENKRNPSQDIHTFKEVQQCDIFHLFVFHRYHLPFLFGQSQLLIQK